MLLVAFQTRPFDGGYRFAIPAVLEVSGCPHTSQSFVAQPTDGARRATFRPRLPGLRGLTVARAFSTECQKETDVAPSTTEPRTGQQCKHSVREQQNLSAPCLRQHCSSTPGARTHPKRLARRTCPAQQLALPASLSLATNDATHLLPPSSSPPRPSQANEISLVSATTSVSVPSYSRNRSCTVGHSPENVAAGLSNMFTEMSWAWAQHAR